MAKMISSNINNDYNSSKINDTSKKGYKPMFDNSAPHFIIGTSYFKDLRQRNGIYVDKTFFIEDLLKQGNQVSLILRPKGFGKTLNINMLKSFFDCRSNDSALFENLHVSKNPSIMQYQGKYPVISLSLNDVNGDTWEECYTKLHSLLRKLYINYIEIFRNSQPTQREQSYFSSILETKGNVLNDLLSLKTLCDILCKHFKSKVVLLVDDYDAPIKWGFINQYYSKVVDFVCGLLHNVLDDNPYLELAVLTGTFEISRDDMLSRIHNLKIFNVLDRRFSHCFGFSSKEVKSLLPFIGLTLNKFDETVKEWYGSRYNDRTTEYADDIDTYNPLSVMNYAYDGCNASDKMSYVADRFNSKYLQYLLKSLDSEVRCDITRLLWGAILYRHINLETFHNSEECNMPDTLYGFLLQAGYLKICDIFQDSRDYGCHGIAISNQESLRFLGNEVGKYLINVCHIDELRTISMFLLNHDWDSFSCSLHNLITQNMNHADTPKLGRYGLVASLLSVFGSICETRFECEGNWDLDEFGIMLVAKSLEQSIIFIKFRQSTNIDSLEQDALSARTESTVLLDSLTYKQSSLIDTKLLVSYGISLYNKQAFVTPCELKQRDSVNAKLRNEDDEDEE